MKAYWVSHLAVLVVGLTISLPKVMAQLAPAAGFPAVTTADVQPPSRTLYASPILAYTPPTSREKLRFFEFDAFGPFAFATATAAGGFQHMSTSPPEWGTGWDGFGMRVGSNFGIQLVTTTTRYGMAAVLREDAAYYRCQCTGFFPRLGHALISTVTGRHGKDGHTSFSISGLVAPYAGTMAALAWYPDRFGVKDGFRMGNYNLLGQAAGNLGLEFIYGGPHTMFRNLRSSKSQGETSMEKNP